MAPPTKEQLKPPLVVICGPTAGGKTRLALELADGLSLEAVSADSRQIYQGMDIGTAKASPEERALLPHHLIDVVRPDEPFTADDFRRLGRTAIENTFRRGRRPLVVGGTGLYIRVLTEGLVPAPGPNPEIRRRLETLEERRGPTALHRLLGRFDPDLARRLHPMDRVRALRGLEVYLQGGKPLSLFQREHEFSDRPFRTLKIGLAPPRELLYRQIDARVEDMFAAGLVDEVKGLLRLGYSPDLKAFRGIGYAETLKFLGGELSLAETVELVQRNTRRFAKRQLTWFCQDPEIIWFETWKESVKIRPLIEKFYVA